MNVEWSNEAKTSFLEIIKNLIEHWPIDIAEDFQQRTDQLIKYLEDNKHIGTLSENKNFRKCIIHPNVSLIYQVLDSTTIELVTFIENRTNHDY